MGRIYTPAVNALEIICDWGLFWARLKQISDMTEDEFTDECDRAEERRIRREEEGICTSDEEEFEEDESEGEESVEELEGEKEEDN